MDRIINTVVRPFRVTAFYDGEFIEVTDTDLRGRWSVLFFYPSDFGFVCPTELGDLADHYRELKVLGVEVFSASTDTHFTHKAWHDSSETVGRIRFPMLADPSGTLARNFGVLIEEEGLALRATFVIDPEGRIKICEMQDLAIGRDVRELVRKIQAAKYVAMHDDEVCPARWQPGRDTLASPDLVGRI